MIGAELKCGEYLQGEVAGLLKLTVGWKFNRELDEKIEECKAQENNHHNRSRFRREK